MKNIIVRSLSGAVYVALIVVLVLWGGDFGFPALLCVFSLIGMSEFLQITQGGMSKNPFTSTLDLFLGLCLIFLAYFLFYISSAAIIFYAVAMACAIIALVIVRLIMQLYSTSPNSLTRMAYTIMALVYVAMPLALTVAVYALFGPALTLLVFVLIWLNDTGAFLVGSAIGSHRLFARLSPNKSWEGFFGGLAFCVIAAMLSRSVVPGFENESEWFLVAMGITVSLLATWGDLFESMLKRNVGVKDSGNIMPGHGGVLDRIDSMLFVMPGMLVLYFLSIVL